MTIPQVAIWIAVAGHEHHVAVIIRHRYFEPDQPLAAKARWHVVAVGATSHLDVEFNAACVGTFGDNIAKYVAVTQHLEPLFGCPCESLELVIKNIASIVAVIDGLPGLRELAIVGDKLDPMSR